jgi:hydroxyacyl-ACP dehydratase HTD2-like protein with hotdog domain
VDPGALGEWISDAEVAETSYTAFASTTGRLIVRRVKDARHRDTVFPLWHYHPFFTAVARAQANKPGGSAVTIADDRR